MLTVWEWCAVELDCKHNLWRTVGLRTDVYGIKRQSCILSSFFSFKIYLFYMWVVYQHICVLGTCRIQMWALGPLGSLVLDGCEPSRVFCKNKYSWLVSHLSSPKSALSK